MRPVRLTLEGFRSYRDRATFSFEGRTLVGVVGPTGSGKSTILDAIAYAMYGRTPATTAVKSLIHNRSDVAQVELWLELDGGLYRVVRSIRAKGSGGQTLERWSALDADAPDAMLTDKSQEITNWFGDRLGLDFEAFSRSVLLAQDKFDQLLKGDRRKADEVLAGLFGFGVIERMRQVVGERLAAAAALLAAAAKARTAQAQLEEEATAARRRHETATGRVEELAGVAESLAGVDAQIGAAQELIGQVNARAEELERVAERVPAREEAERIIAEALDHERLLAAAAAALDTATTEFDRASTELDEAVDAALPDRLAALEGAIAASVAASEALRRARADLDAAARAAADAREAAGVAEAAVVAARSAEEEAGVAAEESSTALREMETRHAAHVLSEELVVGEPCPVCRRAVDALPDVVDIDGLDGLRAEASLAAERRDAAVQARQRAENQEAAAVAKREAADLALETSTRTEEGADRAAVAAGAKVDELLVGLGGAGDDPSAVLATAKADYAALVAAKKQASDRLARATTAHGDLAATDVPATLRALAAAHVDVATAVGLALEPADDADTVGTLVARARQALDEARVDVAEERRGAEASLADGTKARTELLASVGLEPDADHGAAWESARTDVAVAAALATQLDDQVAAGRTALAEADETKVLALRLERLHKDLAPAKFPRYLLEEKRHELATVATDWLEMLSAGRYAFAVEDDRFKIRELTAAGLVRDADTLSGGETFLASLGLALGLASMVGLAHGALQAFFIDEGFGSLDADSLDLAMEGIERLVGDDGDRLVVVVSHVPEMRARIEDLIVLHKDEVTGTTSVIRG